MFWLSSVAQAGGSFVPPDGTAIAERFNDLYSFLLYASAIAGVMVIGGFIYFAFKYRRRTDSDKTAYISHSTALEFLWSFIPFVIFMVVFGWGWAIYKDMRTMPENGLEIAVTGKKWSWSFQYKSGKRSSGEFWVPVDQPVKLVMTSQDVIHSFFIPAFRIKQDVVPGTYTALSFTAQKIGDYQVFCTEFCGDQHSQMLAKVHVVSREDFDQWLQDNPYKGLSMAAVGEQVFTKNCAVCHSTSSEKKVGPGFAGIFGSQRAFADGSSAAADENYLRESILNPGEKVVATFPAAMPTFAGQLSEDEIRGVIEFIKALK